MFRVLLMSALAAVALVSLVPVASASCPGDSGVAYAGDCLGGSCSGTDYYGVWVEGTFVVGTTHHPECGGGDGGYCVTVLGIPVVYYDTGPVRAGLC